MYGNNSNKTWAVITAYTTNNEQENVSAVINTFFGEDEKEKDARKCHLCARKR